MDIEKRRRAELIERLGPTFVCREEVRLKHALFKDVTIRADVVAISTAEPFDGIPIAFEVKEPAADWQVKKWIYCLRQASDYVYARIDRQTLGDIGWCQGRRIAAAFVYPARVIDHFGLDDGPDPMLGAVTLAMHFRVGQARPSRGKPSCFSLAFANNEIWNSDTGFKMTADQFLDGRYRVGSRQINVFSELE
ncbi:hypothetical protein [uncultured Methylobacterium sp.]|uniref:hypothetical protein n=1 Tax=uncultured Methylobacterium sp. TaxID=157278 RepID=UPI0025954F36|nr:hypothetical protein [uncultured Methylobacterium sp.]